MTKKNGGKNLINWVAVVDETPEEMLAKREEKRKKKLANVGEVKRGRGRPKLTETEKSEIRAKREAGKTKSFSVGEEPNKRSSRS